MEQFATFLSNRLIKYGLDPSYKEVYVYSIQCILNTLLPFGILILIGIIAKVPITTLIWIAAFLPLRHTAGGAHASSHLTCFIITIGLGCVCIFFAYICSVNLLLAFIILAFSIAVIIKCAPVTHKNHPLSETYISKARKQSKYIVFTEAVIVIILYYCKSYLSANTVLLAMLTVSLSTLIGYLKSND